MYSFAAYGVKRVDSLLRLEPSVGNPLPLSAFASSKGGASY